MRTLALLLLLVCCAAPLSAATYYVDVANGNDTTGDGSEQYPWATMSKAEANATGGDTVYLRAGTCPKYTANKLYTPVRTSYLTWKAYPGEDQASLKPPDAVAPTIVDMLRPDYGAHGSRVVLPR